ncbi:hypothetical protein Poly21_08970 [Allorhodopirellula heiligendammensis]|uniref:Uncharacterized protein n=1 Tax=Allorhodopirellula heiligendammensis TaxID=2714739 RepID=A0A5C6C5A7_9BACT|nr:hypothetical protein Poly21_08970 [Allorhodopirellula heiligendammensis]
MPEVSIEGSLGRWQASRSGPVLPFWAGSPVMGRGERFALQRGGGLMSGAICCRDCRTYDQTQPTRVYQIKAT